MRKPSRGQQGLYRAQLKRLEQAGWTDEMRRDLLEHVTGKRSTSEIDGEQMARVIDAQNAALRKAGLAPLSYGRRRTMSQVEYILLLARELGWDEEPERLAGFIRRATGGETGEVDELTSQEKTKIINGLKALKHSQADGTAAAERPLARRRTTGEERLRFIPGGRPPCLL